MSEVKVSVTLDTNLVTKLAKILFPIKGLATTIPSSRVISDKDYNGTKIWMVQLSTNPNRGAGNLSPLGWLFRADNYIVVQPSTADAIAPLNDDTVKAVANLFWDRPDTRLYTYKNKSGRQLMTEQLDHEGMKYYVIGLKRWEEKEGTWYEPLAYVISFEGAFIIQLVDGEHK